MLRQIAVNRLLPDSRNPNQCDDETLTILKTHIQRTGIIPALTIRNHPTQSGQYIIIDGHHRWLIAKDLGLKKVACQILDVDAKESGMLLLTLNRLRGEDVPRKRAELMESMLTHLSVDDLSMMLPETSGEIEGLLALLKQEEEALEKALKAQIEAEQQTLPVPFGFMVSADDAPIVREALGHYGASINADQGQALVAICRDALTVAEDKAHG